MIKTFAFLALALPLALMACVPAETAPPPVGQCDAAALQGLVGQPGRVLDGMRFATPVRVIRPGMAVTMDFSPDRLNIWLGAGDVIERVTCG